MNRSPDGNWILVGIAGLVFAIAAALGVVRYAGASPAQQGVEGALASAALAALVATPGVLVLLARADRPSLLVTAGTALVPLSLLSLAGATLPLLVPAVMLLVRAGRRSGAARDRPCAPVAVTTLVVLVLVVMAGLALLTHDDPRRYTTPGGGGEVGDVITAGESLLSLALLALGVTSGWYLAGPRTPAAPPAPPTGAGTVTARDSP